ncbi:MAG TPA: hypothetical protein VLF59_00575 [Candidatus Saccharimonadales bacterium]|nr:hypothetical protein [Candidatus Saccharimonadales bacterium]
MQFPTRPIALTLVALGLSLGACDVSVDKSAQPQSTPSVVVTTTPAPQETSSPTPSDTTDSDNQDSTTTDSPEPDPTTTGPINPDDRAKCLAWLKGPARAKRYRSAAASAGLQVAQMLVNQKRHGKPIRTFDANGNRFTMPAHYSGWAAIATPDNAFYAKARWKNGQIDTSAHITQVAISDRQHTPASKVIIVGPANNPSIKETYWEAAKPTDDTIRITDLRFFDHFNEQRTTIPIPGGGIATLVGPTNLGDLQVLDRAILDLLDSDLKLI